MTTQGYEGSDSSEDEETIPIPVGGTYVQTAKPMKISLKALKVCSTPVTYSQTRSALSGLESLL